MTTSQLPNLFLVAGTHGVGKTTLLRAAPPFVELDTAVFQEITTRTPVPAAIPDACQSSVASPSCLRSVVLLAVSVPTSSNLGAAFPQCRFLKFEEFLRGLAGGWTREGDVQGVWSSGNHVYRDQPAEVFGGGSSWCCC